MEEEFTPHGMSLINPPSAINEFFQILQVKDFFYLNEMKSQKE